MNLKPLLSPKSVALLGASNREGSLGYDMMEMVKNGSYEGKVFPVNPGGHDEIFGYKAYTSLKEIDEPIDNVVMSLAAHRVEEQVAIAIEKGVKSITIFANLVLEEEDYLPGGEKLADRVIKMCEDANIPLMGHNAMGFYNNDIGLRICGFIAPDANTRGNISMLSQSGSVFSTIGHNEPQMKFNLMVATGTGEVTGIEDYINFALDMETTDVVGVYMEAVGKPKEFISALEKARDKKIPIVLMKVGTSELGAEFALSHTGGLAGDDDSFQAILDHYGVIRAESLQEMANLLALFSFYPKVPKGGVAAIADSGGERNLLADDAEAVGLEFAKFSDETMEKLIARQEYGQGADNPLDPWGTGIDFETIFGESMEIMLNDENGALGIMSQDLRDGYYLSEGLVEALERGHKNSGKPVAFLTNFSGIRRVEITKRINEIPAPVLAGTKEGLSAAKKYLEFRDFNYENVKRQAKDLDAKTIELLKTKEALTEFESISILRDFGFPVLNTAEFKSLEELDKIKDEIEYPLVLKTSVEGILHKADVGGVRLGIKNYEELIEEYKDLSEKLGPEAMIAPMFGFESEFIFGMKQDDVFGPVIIVGAGGNLTELLQDSIVLLPSSGRDEIKDKLKTLITYELLTGFRGRKKVDIEKFVDAIESFMELVITLDQYVEEIDINPVAINGDDIYALDSLIVTKA